MLRRPIRCPELFHRSVRAILQEKRAARMACYLQHGDTSCLRHCIAVAYYSLAFADWLHLPCDRESLIRGALLHDYFLYDWHEKDPAHSLHGFRHPKIALQNALTDYRLNRREQNIILRHMFPLVPIPPTCREGFLVCLADKVCSLRETFCRRPYGDFFNDLETV